MHRYILEKNILPRFRDLELSAIERQEIQLFIAQLSKKGYSPNTIDHIHNVLSTILKTAVKWGHLRENPASGVTLPKLVPVRTRWILTPEQAFQLINALSLLPRTIVGLALLTGMRRGELFALRWKNIDEGRNCLQVTEAVYDGRFDTPKTTSSIRRIPLSPAGLDLLRVWRRKQRRTTDEDLLFATRSGNSISPNNILQRHIAPACDKLGLQRATWLTFRRTFSSWSHDQGSPGKVVAQIMGHANVSTTLNVYTQVVEESLRTTVDRVSNQLFCIVQFSGETVH